MPAAVELDHDGHFFAFLREAGAGDRQALGGQHDHLARLFHADAEAGRLGLVDFVDGAWLRGFDIPVDVHHARGGLEDLADLPGQPEPGGLVGSVDLGHDGLQDGRPRGYFRHGEHGAMPGGDRQEAFTDTLRDGMALGRALGLVGEVDLHLGDMRAAPEVGVTDESVEVERRRGADVELGVLDLRLQRGGPGDLLRDLSGALERRTLGHLHRELEF